MRQLFIEQQITQRIPSVERYLSDVKAIDLLAPGEEVRLADDIQNGDHGALKKLVTANLRFVVSVAKQYQNCGLPLSDLINEGNIGLIKAARRFDSTKGFKFISFAVWYIRQHILIALGEQSRVVRIPSNKLNTINKVNSAVMLLKQMLNRKPTVSEIAAHLNITKEEVLMAIHQAKRHSSLDATLGNEEDEDRNMYHLLSNPDDATDNDLNKKQMKTEVQKLIARLNKREQQILCLYYGIGGCEPITLEQIGEKLSLTRERVRQIKHRVLMKIRDSAHSAALRDLIA